MGVAIGFVGILYSLYIVRVTLRVHRISLAVSNDALTLMHPTTPPLVVPWHQIESATLYIRKNWFSRTDRMLVIRFQGCNLTCFPSVFSPEDEEAFVHAVQEHIVMQTVHNRAAV